MPPTPMQPICGRSLAEALAKALGLQLTYGIALPAAAATSDFLRNSRREAWFRVMVGSRVKAEKKMGISGQESS